LDKPQTMRGKCFKCEHRGTIPGDAHSCCKNKKAKVQGDEHGKKMDGLCGLGTLTLRG
jgi:hypothetical protein